MVAAFKAALAASTSFCATAASTFFTAVFTLDLIALFLAAFVSFTKILFLADLILANLVHLQQLIFSNVNDCAGLGHGRSNETYSFILFQLAGIVNT